MPANRKDAVVTFVILHYLNLDATNRCIKSIQEELTYDNYRIVVVDNGSANGTGEKLENIYKGYKKIKVICLESNLGFSAGNNIGYRYAKENFHSDYVIVINNDTEIIQENFVEKVIECFEKENYYVMGPDIINLDGEHQSPLRDYVITRKKADIWYFKRLLFSKYLHIHKKLNLSQDFFVFKKYRLHSKKTRKKIQTEIKQENVELQGACIIFSPLFVTNSNIAFEELTFLYGEEALLLLRCMKNQWKTVYNPLLIIKHIEKASTSVNKDIIEREIFCSDNYVKAISVIRKYLADM